MKKTGWPAGVPPIPETARLAPAAGRIADWFEKNARPLPWRAEPSPYRVWVSEIMLQQTRIEAALPYYRRFVAELPDIPSLAAAEGDRLLKLWEGLGYYSRVRHMQQAAQMAVAQYGGALPADYEKLCGLPGFGEYIAGAVASIAFGIPVPAVDGNVLRVMARLTGYAGDVMMPRVRREFRVRVQGILPAGRPGNFNQGIMELGETVCIPNGAPDCSRCPVAADCEARRAGTAASIPYRAPRKPRRVEMRTVFAILSRGRVLLHRRPAEGLLAGMWELPAAEGWLDLTGAESFLAGAGVSVRTVRPLPGSRHVFSHLEWQMKGFLAETGDFEPPAGCVWADAAALGSRCALASAFRAYSRLLPGLLGGADAGTAPD